MEVGNNVNQKALAFGKGVVIKTQKPLILNSLEDKDCSWREQPNPDFRYIQLSFDREKDGFFRGLLMDSTEKDAMHNVGKLATRNHILSNNGVNIITPFYNLLKHIVGMSQTIEIETAEELKKLLTLKTVDDIIKTFVK